MFAEYVAHNLCCQIRVDDNSAICTFTTGKSVTCTGAHANEIIPNRQIARLLTKQKKDVILEWLVISTSPLKPHGHI